MASVDECRQALRELAARLDRNADTVQRHGSTWTGRWPAGSPTWTPRSTAGSTGGRLVDLADGDDPKAKIALSTSSDDLLALVHGELNVTSAVAARRVSVKANPFDLLKLRKLL